jgi:hypothetical protein
VNPLLSRIVSFDLRSTSPSGRSLAAVTDAIASSAATFGIGLVAGSSLDAAQLGVYALFVSAFVFLAVLPTQYAYIPAERSLVATPSTEAPMLLRHARRRGVLVGSVCGLGPLILDMEVSRTVPWRSLLVANLFCALLIVVSPLQDHTRRSLHLLRQSVSAAQASVLQLLVVAFAVSILHVTHLRSPIWMPFAILLAANLASWALASRRLPYRSSGVHSKICLSGAPLLVLAGIAPAAGTFVLSYMVAKLAGPVHLGHAEAARLVAQPVFVLAIALSAVLARNSMEAGRLGQPANALRSRRRFSLTIVGATASYAFVVGLPTPWNPFAHLLPLAYHVRFLVMITLISQLLTALGTTQRLELIGARRDREVLLAEGAASGCLPALGLVASLLGSMTRPIAGIAGAAMRFCILRASCRKLYRPPAFEHESLDPAMAQSRHRGSPH